MKMILAALALSLSVTAHAQNKVPTGVKDLCFASRANDRNTETRPNGDFSTGRCVGKWTTEDRYVVTIEGALDFKEIQVGNSKLKTKFGSPCGYTFDLIVTLDAREDLLSVVAPNGCMVSNGGGYVTESRTLPDGTVTTYTYFDPFKDGQPSGHQVKIYVDGVKYKSKYSRN